jgi:uncharacterized membrane protein YphA (DoxX/SURF4 family)
MANGDASTAVPTGITHLFLIVNVIAMFASSLMIIVRKHSEYAVMGLIGVVVTQALGYGLIFDLNFFLRNLSVMGGLLMVLSDSWVRKKFAPAGLPQLDEKDRKMYFQLAGRVLLIFLFVGFVFAGDWSIGRVAVIMVGLVACVMVVVGFKAKWSAIILVTILSVFNVFVNNFWTVSRESVEFPMFFVNIRLITFQSTAPRAPPSQGLRQVRLLPDPLHCRRPSPAYQHGTRSIQLRREEEGLLDDDDASVGRRKRDPLHILYGINDRNSFENSSSEIPSEVAWIGEERTRDIRKESKTCIGGVPFFLLFLFYGLGEIGGRGGRTQNHFPLLDRRKRDESYFFLLFSFFLERCLETDWTGFGLRVRMDRLGRVRFSRSVFRRAL